MVTYVEGARVEVSGSMGPGPFPRVTIIVHVAGVGVHSGCGGEQVREGKDASVADVTVLLLLMVTGVIIVAQIAKAAPDNKIHENVSKGLLLSREHT